MKKFYTSVHRKGASILVRGYKNGKRYSEKVDYKPSLFIPSQKASSENWRNIHGAFLKKKIFDSIWDARDFLKTYSDTEGMQIHGTDKFEYAYINETFHDMEYDKSLISLISIDIEVGFNLDDDGKPIGGFPDVETADNPVTAITVSKNGKKYSFGCGDYKEHQDNIRYFKCLNESVLLDSFLKIWDELDPDIVTGWNIDFFDIPYLVNRINRLLGDGQSARLSPWRLLDTRTLEIRGKQKNVYYPVGVASLDYLELYKKFNPVNQESYRLDYIANIELGERKLDYSEYESLHMLYISDFQKYLEYNTHDVELVDRLDDKLKFIDLVLAMAYDAKINYGDCLASVKPWEIIIYNFLMARRIVIPIKSTNQRKDEFEGAYVKEPKIGAHDWVVSLDLDSLYPSIIRQYNISPDRYVGKVDLGQSIPEQLAGGLNEFREMMDSNDATMCANGSMFSKSKQGFMAEIVETMYAERVKYKTLMIEAKKEYEKNPTPELKNKISQYNSIQAAKKLSLNSLYGAMGNRWFVFYDLKYAEAVTMTGQLVVRWIARKLDEYLNKLLNTTNIEYVIYIDTDSCYIKLDALVKAVYKDDIQSKQTVIAFLEKTINSKVQKFIKKSFEELTEYTNAREQVMNMKLECIADRAIWRGKKMYILNVWHQEGVDYTEPKLKIMGIESVRSSTPAVCREKIKSALKIIMNDTEEELQDFVTNFRTEFVDLNFESVAFPRGTNDLEKWANKSTIYRSGTPIHVKGSLIYNHLLKKNGLEMKYQQIYDGDKVKFAYLRVPNPINATVIATPGGMPVELSLDQYIDRDKQFEKSFLGPIESITNVIGWNAEKKSTLEQFFGG